MTSESPHPRSWSEWYRFARDEFGYEHDECVEYANLRFVEEQNRAALRARGENLGRGSSRSRPGTRKT
jgi:hypothetical protein